MRLSSCFHQCPGSSTLSPVLVRYDLTLPVSLATDASAYRVGAVISHTLPDGTEFPIAFISCTLSSSEVNYAQIENDPLHSPDSILVCMGGSHVNRPLATLHHSGTQEGGTYPCSCMPPALGSPLLSAYCYDIRYKSTQDHANADWLSLPLNTKEGELAR